MKHKSLSKSATTPPPLILLISAIVLIVSACGGGGGGGGASSSSGGGDTNSGGGGGGAYVLQATQSVNRSSPITNLNSFTEKAGVRTANPTSDDFLTTAISEVGTPTSRAARIESSTDNATDAFVFQSNTNAEVTHVFTAEDGIRIEIGPFLSTLRSGTRFPSDGKTTPSFAVAFPASGGGSRSYRGDAVSETELKWDSGPGGAVVTPTDVSVAELLALTTRSATANDDTDYVTFGVWLIDRAEAGGTNPPIEVAAFAAGGSAETPIAYLRPSTAVTATYTGDAIMMTGRANEASSSVARTANSVAHGDLTLTATFSSTPTVQGMIADIATIGTNSDTPLPSALTLGSANLQNQDGGFFKGSVVEGSQAIGEWGGQFYGTEAGVVSGTFNVDVNVPALTTPALPAGRLSIVGAFGAEKE